MFLTYDGVNMNFVSLCKKFWSILMFVYMFLCFWFAHDFCVRNILWTQIEILLNQRSWPVYINNSLNVQEDALYWDKYDLIAELDKVNTESERLSIINMYISKISDISSSRTFFVEQEQKKISEYNDMIGKCEKNINSRNSDFTIAVNSYDYDFAEDIADEIAELRACIAKNQVYVKAHSAYISSYNGFSKLEKKAKYLQENKEKIAKYYEILKPDLLRELYNISQTVKTNF